MAKSECIYAARTQLPLDELLPNRSIVVIIVVVGVIVVTIIYMKG
jgi:hypothetical protein